MRNQLSVGRTVSRYYGSLCWEPTGVHTPAIGPETCSHPLTCRSDWQVFGVSRKG